MIYTLFDYNSDKYDIQQLANMNKNKRIYKYTINTYKMKPEKN